jgi:hypothetical protein
LHSCLPRLFQTSEENFISMVWFLWQAE